MPRGGRLELAIDAGLGVGPADFNAVLLRRLPPRRQATKVIGWKNDIPQQHRPATAASPTRAPLPMRVCRTRRNRRRRRRHSSARDRPRRPRRPDRGRLRHHHRSHPDRRRHTLTRHRQRRRDRGATRHLAVILRRLSRRACRRSRSHSPTVGDEDLDHPDVRAHILRHNAHSPAGCSMPTRSGRLPQCVSWAVGWPTFTLGRRCCRTREAYSPKFQFRIEP